MCLGDHGDQDHAGGTGRRRWDWKASDIPPDWETVTLPPDHVMKHCMPILFTAETKMKRERLMKGLIKTVTDAHCHPTDLDITAAEYDQVKLGGIGAMATIPQDQSKVSDLGSHRGWRATEASTSKSGPRVVSCFGYHPWFTHRYSLADVVPDKESHYHSIFFKSNKPPSERNAAILQSLLPYLPDPLPFNTLLEDLRRNITTSLQEGKLTMLGEVGLDGGARMRWPESAWHLYEEKYPRAEVEGAEGEGEGGDEEWNRLTPFKVSMDHQKAIVEAQLEVAIELRVNVSFHSVAAPGPTMEILTKMRNKHKSRFTNHINVDIHSGGGWSPEFWTQAEKQFLNLYASPSIFITGRTQSAPELIRSISSDRILVESDSHDIRLSSRLVWAATEWIAGCKGWIVETGENGDWDLTGPDLDDEEVGADGRVKMAKDRMDGVEVVRTLERNWARFMGLLDDTR